MAYSYLIGQDSDSHQANPFWILYIGRFAARQSLDQSQLTRRTQDRLSVSQPDVLDNPVEEQSPLLFASECTQFSVSGSKDSHVASGEFTIANVGIDLSQQIMGGDWAFFWAFDNEEDYTRVRSLIVGNKQSNRFNDGLKFVGRVASSSRNRSVDPTTGTKTTTYHLSCQGFKELDSALYYNEMLKARYKDAFLQFAVDMAGNINNFITNTKSDGGGVSAQQAIPAMLDIAMGRGPSAQAVTPASFTSPTVLEGTPNKQYQIPQSAVNILLGNPKKPPKKPVGYTYVDILSTYIGIMEYAGDGFQPALKTSTSTFFEAPIPISGTFAPNTMDFNGTIWSVLSNYLNDPINEMYTCLRVNPKDEVVPTLIVRQTPYSSPAMANSNIPTTQFRHLPRWKLGSNMVRSDSISVSDAQRFNYVHLQGEDHEVIAPQNREISFVWAPPFVDDADIRRNGLCMYQRQLSAHVKTGRETPGENSGAKWTNIMADIVMNAKLKYSGHVVSAGIQVPIVHGDNLEHDGYLFHIQAVTHQGGINPYTGVKSFNTILNVSQGIVTPRESRLDTYGDKRNIYTPIDNPESDNRMYDTYGYRIRATKDLQSSRFETNPTVEGYRDSTPSTTSSPFDKQE